MDRHPCMRVYGWCSYGEQCKYAQAKWNTCLYWLKGKCTNADKDSCPHGKHPNRNIAILSTELKNRCKPCPIGKSCKRTCGRSHTSDEHDKNFAEWERFMEVNWHGFRTIMCRSGRTCEYRFCTFKHSEPRRRPKSRDNDDMSDESD